MAALLALAAGLAATVAHADDVVVRTGQDRPIAGVREFTGRIIAKPRALIGSPQAQAARDAALAIPGAALVEDLTQTGELLLSVPAGTDDQAFAAAVLATGRFAYAHPDWLLFPTANPNDPLFPQQWALTKLQAPAAWDITPGSPAFVVALIDTGVNLAHPDLAGQLVNGFNVVSGVPQASGGNVSDVNGHGTGLSGVVAAATNNTLGIAGTAPNVRVMPVRVSETPSGGAPLSTILSGARLAADNGARVVSISYTGITNPSVQTTGAYVSARNAVLLYAAGNQSSDFGAIAYPDVLIVAATDQNDARASFSNFMDGVGIAAPGVSVLTTTVAGGYANASGTSISAPMAAASLALTWSANPSLSASEARTLLTLAADDLGYPGPERFFGTGRVNLLRAAQVAQRGTAFPIAVPDSVAVAVGPAATPGVRLDVLANDADPMGRPLSISGFPGFTAAGASLQLVNAVTGQGGSARPGLLYTPPANATPGGSDSFIYTLSNGVNTLTAAVNVSFVDAAPLRQAESTAIPTAPGLEVTFYNLAALNPLPTALPVDFSALPIDTRARWTCVCFQPTTGPLPGGGVSANFAAVAEGFLFVPQAGVYTLSLTSDEGSRLWIGEQLVVDNDGVHTAQTRSGSIALAPGIHPLRIAYFDLADLATLFASISGPGLSPTPLTNAGLQRWDPLDINRDTVINTDDLSDYITFYFLADPRADYTLDGLIDTDDISEFITDYFARGG